MKVNILGNSPTGISFNLWNWSLGLNGWRFCAQLWDLLIKWADLSTESWNHRFKFVAAALCTNLYDGCIFNGSNILGVLLFDYNIAEFNVDVAW